MSSSVQSSFGIHVGFHGLPVSGSIPAHCTWYFDPDSRNIAITSHIVCELSESCGSNWVSPRVSSTPASSIISWFFRLVFVTMLKVTDTVDAGSKFRNWLRFESRLLHNLIMPPKVIKRPPLPPKAIRPLNYHRMSSCSRITRTDHPLRNCDRNDEILLVDLFTLTALNSFPKFQWRYRYTRYSTCEESIHQRCSGA
jgi:hypothetical protein